MSRNLVLKLSELASAIDRKFDVFICSASYEDRCRSIPNVVAKNLKVGKALVCYNYKSSPLVTANAKYLLEGFGDKGGSVLLDKASPLSTADHLQRALSHVEEGANGLSFLIDITTFTHEALLILLRLLQARIQRGSVVLGYASAKEYSIGLPPEQKWLSKGITDIRSVLGYPGDSLPSRKSHLIVLVGFEYDRAERLIDEYQPHVVSLGFGQLGTETAVAHRTVNRSVFSRLASKVTQHKEFEFSCTDVGAVERAVSAQALLFPDCNVVVAPMNTKLSTVGVAGAAFRNHEIQVCYASASQYNIEGYSEPGDDCILTALSPDFWKGASPSKSGNSLKGA